MLRSASIALFTFLITFVVANNAVFVHSHKLPDGTVIYHAHPYNKAAESDQPFKKHHHTSLEFLLLSSLETLYLLVFFTVLIHPWIVKHLSFRYLVLPTIHGFNDNPRLRGPPMSS